MSRISVKDAVKRYGNNTVIPDLNLEIGDGELFTLLGPSGCGKTTLLRMIAGFNSIEGGDIFFNEKRINDMDPSKRNIGMVFQSFNLVTRTTVIKNVLSACVPVLSAAMPGSKIGVVVAKMIFAPFSLHSLMMRFKKCTYSSTGCMASVIGAAASYAFATPPSTMPMAVVAGTGWVDVKDMFKYGGLMALLSIVILAFVGYPIAAAVL